MAVHLGDAGWDRLRTILEGALTMVIAITIVWPEGDGHYEQAFA